VGSASSARAVGNALHNNPVPIYVPCHRVVSSDGRIGGYVGGAARKLRPLRSEGFAVDRDTASIPGTTILGHKGTKIYCRPSCRTSAREIAHGSFSLPIPKRLSEPACARARFAAPAKRSPDTTSLERVRSGRSPLFLSITLAQGQSEERTCAGFYLLIVSQRCPFGVV